jgi:hypothetical protein
MRIAVGTDIEPGYFLTPLMWIMRRAARPKVRPQNFRKGLGALAKQCATLGNLCKSQLQL